MTKPKILIIEDDETISASLQSALRDACEVFAMGQSSATSMGGLESEPRVTLLDLESPAKPNPEDGLRYLQEWRQSGHRGRVIVYTRSTERSIAVEAVRWGATEVLSKPLDVALLRGIVCRAARIDDLEHEARAGMMNRSPEEFADMLGTSQSIHRIFEAVRKVSTNDAPILIAGESGTGKELTAKAIHDRSLRKHAGFVPINCGAIPETLLESELFGYERGAGTGAIGQTQGKVEIAQGGTLFLDEVGELPSALQVKLLRCMQDRTFGRAGGHQRVEMNVRIIAATNVNLQDAIAKGTFLEDLYYRLAAVQINLPPLRERGEDVLLIATAFLRQAATHYGKPIRGFNSEAREAMRAYAWPGNVRELRNRVGRAVVLAEGTYVGPVDLDIPHAPQPEETSISFKFNQQRIETDLITKAFTLSQGNLSRAAHELGISRSTLYRRLRQYGMDRALDTRRALSASSRAWLSEH